MMPPIKDFDRHNRLVESVRQSILRVNALYNLPYMVTRAVVVRSSETVRRGLRRTEVMEVAVRTEPRPGSRMGRLPGVGTLLCPLIRRAIADDDGEIMVVDIRAVADDPEAGCWQEIDISDDTDGGRRRCSCSPTATTRSSTSGGSAASPWS